MLNDTTQLVKYSKPQGTFDGYKYITDELISILYVSPKAFVHMLKLACSNAFGLSDCDVKSIIDDITKRVSQKTLNDLLSDIDNRAVIELKNRPVINENVIDAMGDNGFQLAVVLTRHAYGDLSETCVNLAHSSELAIQSSTGIFATSFKVGNLMVLVKTSLPTMQTIIEKL